MIFCVVLFQVLTSKYEPLSWMAKKSNFKYGKCSTQHFIYHFTIQTMINTKKLSQFSRDTAGQERFRTITTAYYRGAMGIMLVYDITQEKSFENIKNWIRNIEENASADVEKMLLGNKCELNEKRQVNFHNFYSFNQKKKIKMYGLQVSKERGEQLAVEYGIKFLETSAKSSINVEEAFYTLARDIKSKMEKRLVSFIFLLYLSSKFDEK